jgi:hypothetical protein
MCDNKSIFIYNLPTSQPFSMHGLTFYIQRGCCLSVARRLDSAGAQRPELNAHFPGSTAILANAPATLVEYSVSAVFCPISVQYRKSIKSRFADADVSGYAAVIGEMQLSEI